MKQLLYYSDINIKGYVQCFVCKEFQDVPIFLINSRKMLSLAA